MGNHTLPGMDAPELLLNLLEMWMALVFRSLPIQILEAWVPDDVNSSRKEGKEGEFGGLNIAIPLDQGGREREWVDLSECGDPLVLEYLGIIDKKPETEQKKQSDVLSTNTEAKKEVEGDAVGSKKRRNKTDNVEEVFAERRRKYTELAKRRNRRDYGANQVSPVTVVAIGVAVVFGIMLLRNKR